MLSDVLILQHFKIYDKINPNTKHTTMNRNSGTLFAKSNSTLKGSKQEFELLVMFIFYNCLITFSQWRLKAGYTLTNLDSIHPWS